MKRWNVETEYGTMKLYYADYDTALKAYPNAISITENTDKSHLEYIDKIIEKATDILKDCKNRTVYKIPHNSGFVLVRVYTHENEFIDGLDYQIHSPADFAASFMWTYTTPEKFYKKIMQPKENIIGKPVDIISITELRKLRPQRFYYKNNKGYWRDSDGYFYIVDKSDLPTRKKIEEYDRFKYNSEAVLAKFGGGSGIGSTKWFNSLKQALIAYSEYAKAVPSSYQSPFFKVVKKGYNKLHPNDRKVVFRLPYFDLENELKIERGESANEKAVSHRLARKWAALMDGYKQFGEWYNNVDWLQDVVEKYFEFKD